MAVVIVTLLYMTHLFSLLQASGSTCPATLPSYRMRRSSENSQLQACARAPDLPQTSGVSTSTSPSSKRKSPTCEEEDEAGTARKKSRTDAGPKKHKFKTVCKKETDETSDDEKDSSISQSIKRKSSDDEEEESAVRKKSRTEDMPKKHKFKAKHVTKTDEAKVCSTSAGKSEKELEEVKTTDNSHAKIIKEEREKVTKDRYSINGNTQELDKKYKWLRLMTEGGFGRIFTGLRRGDNLPVIQKIDVRFTTVEMDGHSVTIPTEVDFLIKAGAGPNSRGSTFTQRLLDWYDIGDDIVLVIERSRTSLDLVDYSIFKGICPTKAKIIFRQLVDAAIELHSKGIFHRDIKPDNVLVEGGHAQIPKAWLIDFGTAAFFTPGQTFQDPQGTLEYSSPEWFRQGMYTAEPTTVWQLGHVLYYMFFSRMPLIRQKSISSTRSVPIPHTIAPEIRDLLRGCLKKNPDERLSLQKIRDHRWLNSK
ncbi:hypothetical protein WMY93_010278 [Mugilogobius chulae]|uniref:Serine/threonine-protein kinase 1 n=1 Tax=Mugilogobius chulae TaxID=88201 RepID=A0AAW0PFZ7_9GOBI